MTDTAYRSSPTDLSGEFKRVVEENRQLRSEWRQRSRNVFWGAAGVSVVSILVLGVVFLFYWTCFRGSAWGVRARRNAEREALAYTGRTYPNSTLRANCYDSPVLNGELSCEVYGARGGSVVIKIVCDDDEAFRNDGCRNAMENPVQQ